MKALKRLWYTACAAMLCLCLLPACGDSNGDEPDNPNPINPDKEVADPAGTVKLSMRSEAAAGDSKTVLEGCLWIDGADNFCLDKYSSHYIIDLGSMKGLGNIESIPPMTEGWAEKVKVTPGHGYLMSYYNYNEQCIAYYRIYVCNYIKNAVGEIIGADIKYQKPFYGIDEELKPNKKSITVNPGLSTAYITFDNSTIIPFLVNIVYYSPNYTGQCFSALAKLTENHGYCVELSSYRNYKSLHFGTEFKAQLRLTTLYGRSTIVDIRAKSQLEDYE